MGVGDVDELEHHEIESNVREGKGFKFIGERGGGGGGVGGRGGGGGGVKRGDVCYGMLRAAACVDESDHHALMYVRHGQTVREHGVDERSVGRP